jgi:hypothetical protein
MTDR